MGRGAQCGGQRITCGVHSLFPSSCHALVSWTVSLMQPRVTWERLTRSDCPVYTSVADCLDCQLMLEGSTHCGQHHSPRNGILGCRRRQLNVNMGVNQQAVSLRGFCFKCLPRLHSWQTVTSDLSSPKLLWFAVLLQQQIGNHNLWVLWMVVRLAWQALLPAVPSGWPWSLLRRKFGKILNAWYSFWSVFKTLFY